MAIQFWLLVDKLEFLIIATTAAYRSKLILVLLNLLCVDKLIDAAFWYISVYTDGMTFLERLCNALNEQQLEYALVGGHAVALYGAVRGTIDVDFVVRWSRQCLLDTEATLNNIGLVSRLPINADDVFNFREEYIENRNLIAWNFYNPANLTEQVDIVINFKLKANSIKLVKVGNTSVPLLKLNQLIKMKSAAGRPQDLQDIAALEKLAK